MTSRVTCDKEINEPSNDHNEPPRLQHDKPERPREVMENESPKAQEQIIQPTNRDTKMIGSLPKPVDKGKGRSTTTKVLRQSKTTPHQHPIYQSLDMPEDSRILIILRRPFLAIAYVMIDVYDKKITLRIASANEIDEKKPELKDLTSHLEYAYLYNDKCFPIIISSKLSEKEKGLLLHVLEKSKGEIAWKMSDIKGISPSFCTHKILMEDDFKPVIQPQRRLNPKVQDVDAKPRHIQWVLLLQGFNIEIKDRKGAEYLVAYHLSRLENPHMEMLNERELADEFPNDHLIMLKTKFNDDEPWYVDFVNYIVGKVVPPKWTSKKRNRFYSQVKNYFWDEYYAFKLCADNIMRRCVAGSEILEILAYCHSGATGGHHSAYVTERKVYEFGFYWPSVFKDAKEYVMKCDTCQIRKYIIKERNASK
ncbi:reverse transcriptase domain-containing protein [Tanacetum coccineum]